MVYLAWAEWHEYSGQNRWTVALNSLHLESDEVQIKTKNTEFWIML